MVMNLSEEDPNYTVVEYLDDHSGYKCGYCKSPDSNFSHGMWAHRMTVGHYQALIDRGWRRSGKYCYKPTMDQICCPQYTIRCDSSNFKLSKSQKKVLKRMHNFLAHGSIKAETNILHTDNSEVSIKDDVERSYVGDILKQGKVKGKKGSIEINSIDVSKEKDSNDTSIQMELSGPGPSEYNRKHEAKQIVKNQKMDSKTKTPTNKIKSIEDYLNEQLPQNATHELKLKLVKVSPEEVAFVESLQMTYKVYRKYQMKIHNDSEDNCDEDNFCNFLVNSPLSYWKSTTGPQQGYGSFHHQYWLDGELIAVGVLDILPHCISSVYLYYDPKYSFLSLGTYASLREIALTRVLNKNCPELRYYYMGFYIHSCPKMRYKGNYYPSSLLCPETYAWQPIEICRPKLDVCKYSRLESTCESKKMEDIKEISIDRVLCLFRSNPIWFKDYRKKHKCTEEELAHIKQYVEFVGSCANSMYLYRST